MVSKRIEDYGLKPVPGDLVLKGGIHIYCCYSDRLGLRYFIAVFLKSSMATS